MNKTRKIVFVLSTLTIFGLTINIATSEKKGSALGYFLTPFTWTGQKAGEAYQALKNWRAIKTEIESQKQEIKEEIEQAYDLTGLIKQRKNANEIINNLTEKKEKFSQEQINRAKNELDEFLSQITTNRSLEIIQNKRKNFDLYVESIMDTLEEAKEEAQKLKKELGIIKYKGLEEKITKYRKKIDESFYNMKKETLRKINNFFEKTFDKSPPPRWVNKMVQTVAKKTAKEIEETIDQLKKMTNKKLKNLEESIPSEEEVDKHLKLRARERTLEKLRPFMGKKE